jgi:hypothetical protein
MSMAMGVSLMLAAAGAILIWAVNTSSSSFNVHAAGVVLLVVGIIGFCLSLAFWSSWGGWGVRRDAARPRNDVTVIDR